MEVTRAAAAWRGLPLGAFSYATYRQYWGTSLAVVLGENVRLFAQYWLAWDLPRSEFFLGLVGLAAAVSTIMLAFLVLLPAFALSRSFPLSLALLGMAGIASAVYLNFSMTLIQTLVPDDIRGRVMAVWSFTWFMMPLGGFQAGAVASILGTPAAVAMGGSILGVLALAATAPQMRRL